MNNIDNKQIEVFCGTGGVGKTTLAASRALYLAQNNKKVLLITIDPAKRLKQILGLNDDNAGDVTPVTIHGQSMDALLMNEKKTIQRIIARSDKGNELNSRIVDILVRPYGGMNEILSLIELRFQLTSKKYDTIVLDTPPGKNFLDFLKSAEKINRFFDSTFVEMFNFLANKIGIIAGPKTNKNRFMNKIVSVGLSKVFKYLDQVTGKTFVEEFTKAVHGIYENKNYFLEALKLTDEFKDKTKSNWFLVSSSEHSKMEEALTLQSDASQYIHQDNYLLVNHCCSAQLDSWKPTQKASQDVKEAMLNRENELKDYAKKSFEKVKSFPLINSSNPVDHILDLSRNW